MNSIVNSKVNSKTILEMAHEAGFEFNRLGCTYTSGYLEDYLDRFAALVRADEREACAKLVEPDDQHKGFPSDYLGGEEGVELLDCISAKIRARGNT